MPEITDITAISVVVARMMPSSVRKLRSLLPRSDCSAPITASQNDACVSFKALTMRAGCLLAFCAMIHSIIAASAQKRWARGR